MSHPNVLKEAKTEQQLVRKTDRNSQFVVKLRDGEKLNM